MNGLTNVKLSFILLGLDKNGIIFFNCIDLFTNHWRCVLDLYELWNLNEDLNT